MRLSFVFLKQGSRILERVGSSAGSDGFKGQVGCIPFRVLISVGLAGLAMVPPVYFLALEPYQQDRIRVPIDMAAGRAVNVKGEGWALDALLKAVGSSGWEGKGVDVASQQANLPNLTMRGIVQKLTAHDDFIFEVVWECSGFCGAWLLVGGVVFFVFRKVVVVVVGFVVVFVVFLLVSLL